MTETVAQPERSEVESAPWQAVLRLRLSRKGERTQLSQSAHRGPLRVQRPFYPEPTGTCHVYLLHPPGGVVGGDVLELALRTDEDASALVTTPGAGKWYRSAGRESRLMQSIQVEAGGCLEFLPQENIAFAGARAQVRTRIDLRDASARFFGWDILCLGRPACDEPFDAGQVRQHFELRRAGRLSYWDRSIYAAGSELMHAAWGLRGLPVVGTLICSPAAPDWVDRVRDKLGPRPDLGLTWLHETLLARYLGDSTRIARGLFEQIWHILRPKYAQQEAVPPRIWNT